MRHALTDEQWALIADLFPSWRRRGGRQCRPGRQ